MDAIEVREVSPEVSVSDMPQAVQFDCEVLGFEMGNPAHRPRPPRAV